MSIFRRFRWPGCFHPLRNLGLCAVLVVVLVAGGCSNPLGLPTSGSVRQLSPIENQQHRVFSSPEGPVDGAGPESIVRGFLAALPTGIQSDGFAVAKSYMTKKAFEGWDFNASVSIYKGSPVYDRLDDENGGKATALDLTTDCIGSLDAHGIFSATDQGGGSVDMTNRFELAKVRGQWRISKAPSGIVISSDDFMQVYRQVVIYQFSFAKGVPAPGLDGGFSNELQYCQGFPGGRRSAAGQRAHGGKPQQLLCLPEQREQGYPGPSNEDAAGRRQW